MHSVRWNKEARLDLVNIVDYVAQYNQIAANKLHDTLSQAAERLASMPYAFRPGRVAGTREYVVLPNYILVYRVGEAVIDILGVLHSRKEYP